MRRWIPLVFLITTFFAKAQDPRSEAIQRILHTNLFAFGGVGFAGTTSDGEKDFRVIISLPSAAKDFETICATGTPEAKGYALAAMRELDKVRFKEFLRSLQSSHAQVSTMSGCIQERRSLVKVAREIDSGRYDIWIKSDSQLH